LGLSAPQAALWAADSRGEMTTIRTTCPRCGEVDMCPESILLSIRDRAGEGSYRFSCPTCMNTIEKPADRKVLALLLSAGVVLASSLHRFQDEVRPVLEDIQRSSDTAQRRMQELSERPGDRLRR